MRWEGHIWPRSSTSSWSDSELAWRSASSSSSSPSPRSRCSSRRGSTRPTAPGRSSAPSSGRCSTRSRCASCRESSRRATTSWSTRSTASSASRPLDTPWRSRSGAGGARTMARRRGVMPEPPSHRCGATRRRARRPESRPGRGRRHRTASSRMPHTGTTRTDVRRARTRRHSRRTRSHHRLPPAVDRCLEP